MTPPRISQTVRVNNSRLMGFLGDMPTTQARVLVTLIVVLATGAKYVLSPTWEPSYEWLAFLVVMSGLDATQFLVKRKTDANYVAAQSGVVPDPDMEAARGKAP